MVQPLSMLAKGIPSGFGVRNRMAWLVLSAWLGGAAWAGNSFLSFPQEVSLKERAWIDAEIPRPQRVSLSFQSSEPISVEVFDPLRGPVAQLGPGRKLRWDRSQPQGRLRARIQSPRPTSVQVDLKGFQELQIAERLLLRAGVWHRGELSDHQSRTYWMPLEAPQFVSLEAVGTELGALEVFLEGVGKIDLPHKEISVESRPGEPWQVHQVFGELPEGLYRVVISGAKGQDWVRPRPKDFGLRWGYESLGRDMSKTLTQNPWGFERWHLPVLSEVFEARFEKATKAESELGPYSKSSPYPSGRKGAQLTPASLDPVLTLQGSQGQDGTVWTLFSPPGSKAHVRALPKGHFDFRPSQGGDFYVALARTRDPSNELDPGIEIYQKRRDPKGWVWVRKGRTVPYLGVQENLARTLDFEGSAELFFDLVLPQEVSVFTEGLGVEHRISPRFLFPPNGFSPPRAKGSGETWSLDKGSYRLEIFGKDRGRLEVSVRAKKAGDYRWREVPARTQVETLELELARETTILFELERAGRFQFAIEGLEVAYSLDPEDQRSPDRTGASVLDLGAGTHRLRLRPARPGFAKLRLEEEGGGRRFLAEGFHSTSLDRVTDPRADVALVKLEKRDSVKVLAPNSQGNPQGIVWRRLPLDIQEPFLARLGAGEILEVPVQIPSRGDLLARLPDGSPASVEIGSRTALVHALKPGVHRVRIRAHLARAEDIELSFSPEGSREVFLDAKRLAASAYPSSTALAPNQKEWVQARKGDVLVRRFEVKKPGVVRFRSHGLSQLQGRIRTDAVPRLAEKDQNSDGGNFDLPTFLSPGNYQLAVRVHRPDSSRIALEWSQAPLKPGADLVPGATSSLRLDPFQGAEFSVAIAEAGRYRLGLWGPGGDRPYLLLDPEGTPRVSPGETQAQELYLEPGSYRLLALPTETGGRRRAWIEATPSDAQISGQGPHPLSLGETQATTYRTDPSAPKPDVWTFELGASAEVQVELSEGAEAQLQDSSGAKFLVVGGRTFSAKLSRGAVRVEVSPRIPTRELPYTLGISTQVLTPGQSRQVDLPGSLRLQVDSPQTVEISTHGIAPIRAKLWDRSGSLLQELHPTRTDWNLAHLVDLPAGESRLELLPSSASRTVLRLRDRPRKEAKPWDLGNQKVRTHELSRARLAIPLKLSKPRLVHLESVSGEPVRLRLIWLGEGSVLRSRSLDPRGETLVLDPQSRPVLEAFRTREGPGEIRLKAQLPRVKKQSAKALARGLSPGWYRVPRAEGAHRLVSGRIRSALAPFLPLATARSPETLVVSSPEFFFEVLEGPARLEALALEDSLSLSIPPEGLRLELGAAKAPIQIFTAEATRGRLGLWLEAEGLSGQTFNRGSTSSLVSLAPKGPLRIRDLEREGRFLPAKISRRGLSPQPLSEFDQLRSRAELPPQTARSLKLPSGKKELRLTLAEGTLAFTSQGDQVERVVAAFEGPQRHSFPSQAETLTFVSSAEVAPVRWQIRPQESGFEPLDSVGFRTLKLESRANVHLPFDCPEEVVLRVLAAKGEDIPLTVFQGSMSAQRDHEASLVGKGWVSFEAPRGLTGLFLSAPGQTLKRIAPGFERFDLNRPEVGKLSRAKPSLLGSDKGVSLLRVRARGPYWFFGGLPQGRLGHRLFESNLDWVFPTQKEQGPLYLRSLDESLEADLRLESVPVARLREGVGPPSILGPEEADFYRVRLESPGRVGLSLRSSQPGLELEAFDTRGLPLGKGRVLTLDGVRECFVRIENPSDLEVATYQPVLVGSKAPASTPPVEEIDRLQREHQAWKGGRQ